MKKKKTIKSKIINILKSYKTIIILSFLINIILLIFSYNIMINNHKYIFDSNDKNIRIKDGLIIINNDINIFYGNNITYVNEDDYDIESLTIGYYVENNNKELKELISNTYNFDDIIKLSDAIHTFSNFNILENNDKKSMFTPDNVKYMNNGLYLVIKAKTTGQNDVDYKIKLNVTKISNF